ncbi:TPA_asm: hypothetical protein [Porphyromonas phage phage022a_WW2931]|uniref:Uncharacterized protein n=1 Tax=Porphyromonas phage phage022a_WW2931 TaxID=3154112 RepID=A0AAT9JMA3_9CAUD|nr:hypothetical protein [Porphyromonas gingivalis]PDP66822.1 hypothetical protein CLI78_02120 [Porphyromonas gingivalis]
MDDVLDKLEEIKAFVDGLSDEFTDKGCAVVMAAHGGRCMGSVRGSYKMLTKLLAYCMISDSDFENAVDEALRFCKKKQADALLVAFGGDKKKNSHVC